jgi:uncharacterized protein YuzE
MAKRIAPLTIGPYTFDHASYDKRGDVLYLSIGPPGRSVVGEDGPEGHMVEFDEQGQVSGLQLINARWYLDRDGEINVTMPVPERLRVDTGAVEGVLSAAA